MAKQFKPDITQDEFDAKQGKLRADLQKWWDDEAQDFDAAVRKTNKVWSTMMPEIDSKAVVKASPIIKAVLGTKLDPRFIKKGGYVSFDALVTDLFPKLRNSCLVGTAAASAKATATPNRGKAARAAERR